MKHLSADPDFDSLDSLDKLCEEYKISIAIHPHGPSGKKALLLFAKRRKRLDDPVGNLSIQLPFGQRIQNVQFARR